MGRGSRHTLPPPGWKHWATACLSVVLCGAGSLLSGPPRSAPSWCESWALQPTSTATSPSTTFLRRSGRRRSPAGSPSRPAARCPGFRSGPPGIRNGDKGSSVASGWSTAGHPPAPCRFGSSGIHAASLEGDRVMRLELTCETCGSQIADPPTIPNDRPVLVCCKASLAKAKARRSA